MGSLKDKHTRELLALLQNTRASQGDEMLELHYVGYTSAEIKTELATREHIPNKQEAKALRQTKAKEKRSR